MGRGKPAWRRGAQALRALELDNVAGAAGGSVDAALGALTGLTWLALRKSAAAVQLPPLLCLPALPALQARPRRPAVPRSLQVPEARSRSLRTLLWFCGKGMACLPEWQLLGTLHRPLCRAPWQCNIIRQKCTRCWRARAPRRAAPTTARARAGAGGGRHAPPHRAAGPHARVRAARAALSQPAQGARPARRLRPPERLGAALLHRHASAPVLARIG